MQELAKRIALLRLLLADIEGKQSQVVEMERQYRAQLTRIVEFVVYREGDVANALSLMTEVQGKLDEALQTAGHLAMLSDRATLELEALLLTKRVAEARSQLAELEDRQRELSEQITGLTGGDEDSKYNMELRPDQMADIRSINEEVAEVAEEIARLHNLITEASERAVRTIQSGHGRKRERAARQETG
jgi:hypothetical protein